MSFLSRVFGGKKEEKGPTPGEAIQKLRETEELLIKKQDFLEKKIEQEIGTARKNGTKNKRAAIAALKRKKRYEKQLTQIDGTLSQIEMQREALEGASTNAQIINVMKDAADAMKLAHKDLDVDKVHELTDDIAEQNEIASEISDAIGKAVGFEQDVDEDELEKELEDLEQNEMASKISDAIGKAVGLEQNLDIYYDVDKVHDIMDDIAEQHDVSREITEAITNSVAFQSDIDEDELEKELEDLEQEDLDRELIGVNAPEHELPEVPTGEVVPSKPKPAKAKVSKEDEDDLAQLQSWAT